MSLTVGICRVELRIPENHSLKGKRQLLKSLGTFDFRKDWNHKKDRRDRESRR